jgi:hypothetical protein
MLSSRRRVAAAAAPNAPAASRCLAAPAPARRAPPRGGLLAARASDSRDSGFTAGFILGGVVFGALGFLFAPQISRALLGEDDRLRLPRVLATDEPAAPRDPEAAKQDLIDKIAQLNASIDEVASQLRQKEDTAGAGGNGGGGGATVAAAIDRAGVAVEQALG